MIPSDIRHELSQAGLRVTAPRLAVLRWLADHPHATAEQIRCGVTHALGSVSTQTSTQTIYDVYDVLAACTAAALVRRIEPAGHPAVNLRPCLTPSEDHGYLLDEAEVMFWGICPYLPSA